MMRLRDHASVFATDRLTPPPNEAYSLQRKLAGVYMTCIRLGARFDARALLEEVLGNIDSTRKSWKLIDMVGSDTLSTNDRFFLLASCACPPCF